MIDINITAHVDPCSSRQSAVFVFFSNKQKIASFNATWIFKWNLNSTCGYVCIS